VGWVFKSGLLTARELERLAAPPLLVVANACLSARTSAKGDRPDLLPSLADEFFRRGVRDYVGTAWEVNDEGAGLFAETFYRALLGTSAPPLGEAVRAARRALFERRALFGSLWAAYQHYGDPATRLQVGTASGAPAKRGERGSHQRSRVRRRRP
jgi:CHAT domain-containing protein